MQQCMTNYHERERILSPVVFPDQDFICPCSKKVAAISISGAGQATIRVTDDVTIFIKKIRKLIAALRRKIIYFLPVVEVLIYSIGGIALRLIF